jgi:hypothetical protein
LGLYYSSVETLEIPLYDERNVAHVRQWLAESSLQHYPVLLDLAFAITADFRDNSEPIPNTVRPVFRFVRQAVNAAEELEREASSRVPTIDGPDVDHAAYLAAHVRCLGLSSIARETNPNNSFIGRHSQRSTDAIHNRETWTSRHIDILAAKFPWGLRRVICL